jgi:CheY-like chemotaxis protein
MDVGRPPATGPSKKISILLMDANPERRALREKVLALHGIDVVVATDLTEATSIWHPDRYDLILIDIRMDHRSCIAWRDEIKKEKPQQIVAFLVGKPNYVELNPSADSYVGEQHGMQWEDSLRLAIRESCASLPERNGLLEARWRIAAGKKLNGTSSHNSWMQRPAERSQEVAGDTDADEGERAAVVAARNEDTSPVS